MWTCKTCATKVDPSFEVCWHCGTSIDGVADPTFVTADSEESPVIPIEDPTATNALISHDALVECYVALDLMQAQFLADQLTEAGIPAVSDAQDFHESLGLMNATPRVRVLPNDLERARQWLAEYEQTVKNEKVTS